MKRILSLILVLAMAAGCFGICAQAADVAFRDVTEADYFYDSVLWALENKITTGLDAEHFGPAGECTRGQAVTFLWRAAGEPAPESKENPFRDVSSDAYYYNAVLWAVEQGITNGMGADTFAPDGTCTRGQIVTFLWRYGDCPTPASGENPFTDADANAYYGKAMLWAVESAITNGMSATTFAPDATCTRGQIVTFLYRAVSAAVCPDCKENEAPMTFGYDWMYTQTRKPADYPLTLEAVFQIERQDMQSEQMFSVDRLDTVKETVLFSNDDTFEAAVTYSITEAGNPQISLRHTGWFRRFHNYVFDKVNVFSKEPVHMAIVLDQEHDSIHCYVNGEKKQTLTGLEQDVTAAFATKRNFSLGGDQSNGNPNYFLGRLYRLDVWSDIRTGEEIAADVQGKLDYKDTAMIGSYDLTRCEKCALEDLSPAENHLQADKLWLNADEVEPVEDFAYSFVVVGDTQELSEDDPALLDKLYEWIVENKEKEKIEYVLGMGDITQKSYDYEWEYAKSQIYKLNGVVPYLLARGNHDILSDAFIKKGEGSFNTTFNDGIYNQQLTGVMTEGDMTCAYRTLKVGQIDYLFITVDFGPTVEMLEWAGQVADAHPDHRVILTTHAYLYRDGTTLDGEDAFPASTSPRNRPAELCMDGDDIWEKFASQHPNVHMVLSGHDPAQHIIYRQDPGVNGNTVTQMLINPQHIDGFLDPTALVAMFYFSEDGNTLTVRYYSVVRDQYGSARSQFTISLCE